MPASSQILIAPSSISMAMIVKALAQAQAQAPVLAQAQAIVETCLSRRLAAIC